MKIKIIILKLKIKKIKIKKILLKIKKKKINMKFIIYLLKFYLIINQLIKKVIYITLVLFYMN
jgi:hypothetical protein